MNCTKGAKLKRISLILTLVFILALAGGIGSAFASNLEVQIEQPILNPANSLNQTINSISQPVITESGIEATTMVIQRKLVSLGYDTGGIDGIYGPKTRRAVMLFQKSRNLVVDGIVGPQTRAALGIPK